MYENNTAKKKLNNFIFIIYITYHNTSILLSKDNVCLCQAISNTQCQYWRVENFDEVSSDYKVLFILKTTV